LGIEPNANTGAPPVDEEELLFHHSPVDEEDRNSSAVEEDDDENPSSAMLSVSPFHSLPLPTHTHTHVCPGLSGSDLARQTVAAPEEDARGEANWRRQKSNDVV
jgi:hypothetical protein